MARPTYSVYLQCSGCENVEFADADQLLARLRKMGMMRRDAEPSNDLIKEMVERMCDGFKCATCDNVGLTTSDEDPFDDEEWGQARKCERCKATIPAERIEVFPDTRLCTSCKAKVDAGEETDEIEPDYCPKCGDIRQLKARGGSGIAGYKMYCPTCRR